MISSETVSLCAQNNALLCDAVLSAAGANTRFQSDYWHSEDKQLPLYPNVVTLNRKTGPELMAALTALPPKAAVKDSFDCLELHHRGFDRLFRGTWLYRPAISSRKPPAKFDRKKVLTQDALIKWLEAWNGNESLHQVFPPNLLKKQALEFAMIEQDGAIKAGCTMNFGPKQDGKEMIGVSNIYYRKKWLYGALQALLGAYPHHPICTYETDADHVAVYRQLDFQECGSLSVWVKR